MVTKVAVVSNSAELHAKNIVHAHNEYYKDMKLTHIPYDDLYDTGFELCNISEFDILLNIGYFVPIAVYLESVRKAEPDMKIVNCWIGSDILQNLGHFTSGMEQHVRAANNYVNICDAPWFADELKDFFKIKAQVVKTTPKELLEPCDLPFEPAIAVHMPHYRRAFYNFEMVMEVCSLNTDTIFHLLGHPEPKPKPNLENVIWHRWASQKKVHEIMKRSTAVIRAPMHDGIAVSTLEALSAGRYVITNIPNIPHTIYAPKMIDIGYAIRKLRREKDWNIEGSQWVRNNYSPRHMADTYHKVLENL